MISVVEIQKAAERERDRLQTIEKWTAAYKDARPQDPLIVEGRTIPEKDYYIVEFRRDDRTTGVMLVNALTGEVGSITGIQTPDDTLYRFYRPTEIPSVVLRHHDLFPGTVTLDEKEINVQAALHWVPSDQSVTPFRPFYVVKAPGLKGDLYVRVDGEVYTRLTHGGAGM